MSEKVLPTLSIVIGALREEKRIGHTLDSLSTFLKDSLLYNRTEVVVVVADGGDRTKDIALTHKQNFSNFKLVEPGKPFGKGRDVKAGMLRAEGDIRLYMDADLATPLHHINTVIYMFEHEKPDIVIGTRKLTAIHQGSTRRLISIFGNFCFLLVSGFYSPDTQCGFKAFSKKSTEICFNGLTRMKWSFDMELLTIANTNKLRVLQIPINDWRDQPDGTFKPGIGSSIQFFKDLMRIFINRITGKYKGE